MITKEMFLKYEEIRNDGMYNMIMDADSVMDIMGIGKAEYYDIIRNYNEYWNKFCK